MFPPRVTKGGVLYIQFCEDRRKKLGDRFLYPRTDKPDREGGNVSAHEKLTNQGDHVVIVGGGNGITAVRSAKLVGSSGKVFVYEGGFESVEQINKVARINDVAHQCEVRHAIVGGEHNVYVGDSDTADQVDTKDLPECDVLELDCEGSEVEILDELNSSPRVVIAELHPWQYPDVPRKPLQMLNNLGYDVKYSFGHDGVELSESELSTLLQRSSERKGLDDQHNRTEEMFVSSGARWPVVIAATK